MEFIIDSLRTDWVTFLTFAPRLLYGAILLSIFMIAGKFAGSFAGRLLGKTLRFQANERFLRRLVTWVISSIGILMALGVMGFQGIVASLLATGGVLAIVLGFAFREIGENFLAGVFLTFSRPFELGDLVKTGDTTGLIRSVDLRCVHIRTHDGCDVFVPNAQIFREPLHNYTRDGLRRPSFTIGVAYHDDPEHVLSVLEEAARTAPDVLPKPKPFVTVKEFSAQYVVYEVFFWLDITKSKRGFIATTNDVKISCWRSLRDAGMTFSTDVSTGLDLQTAPNFTVEVSRGD